MKIADGFVRYFEGACPDAAEAAHTLVDHGEAGLLTNIGPDFCRDWNLPVPSDLVDMYMELYKASPEDFEFDLEAYEGVETCEPIYG